MSERGWFYIAQNTFNSTRNQAPLKIRLVRVDTTHYCSLDSDGQRVKGLKQSGPSIRAVKLTKMQLNAGVPRNLRVNTIVSRARHGNSLCQCCAFSFNCFIARIFPTYSICNISGRTFSSLYFWVIGVPREKTEINIVHRIRRRSYNYIKFAMSNYIHN